MACVDAGCKRLFAARRVAVCREVGRERLGIYRGFAHARRPALLRPACFPRGNDVPRGCWGEQLGTTHPTDGPADDTREGRGLGCVRAERGDRGGAGRRVRRSARGAGASTSLLHTRQPGRPTTRARGGSGRLRPGPTYAQGRRTERMAGG